MSEVFQSYYKFSNIPEPSHKLKSFRRFAPPPITKNSDGSVSVV